jgi:hypothetical protein
MFQKNTNKENLGLTKNIRIPPPNFSQCTYNISCQYDAMFSSYCTYLFIYIYTTKQNVTLTAINHFFHKCCMLCFDGTPFMICLCVVSIDQEDISGLMMNILIMQTIRPIIAFYFIFLFMLIRHSSSNKMNIRGHPILFRSNIIF